ncbi:hypothetical protein [Marivivens marinus]|uniref:hypothetical protein n=1 Tax=Marivivens marinus TaxID=3110173 RepID=UPI003B845514
MFKRYFAAAAIALTVAGASHAQQGQSLGAVPVDEGFIIDELETRGGLPRITIALAALPYEGKIAICAAVSSRRTPTLRQIMRAMDVSSGTRTIQRGLHFAAQYPEHQNLMGQPANCVLTNAPAVENPDLGLSMSRTRF